jgi:hypothetical protein
MFSLANVAPCLYLFSNLGNFPAFKSCPIFVIIWYGRIAKKTVTPLACSIWLAPD